MKQLIFYWPKSATCLKNFRTHILLDPAIQTSRGPLNSILIFYQVRDRNGERVKILKSPGSCLKLLLMQSKACYLLGLKETWYKSHSVLLLPSQHFSPHPYLKPLPLRGWPSASLPRNWSLYNSAILGILISWPGPQILLVHDSSLAFLCPPSFHGLV